MTASPSLHLVTALLDVGKREGNPDRQSVDFYFDAGQKLLLAARGLSWQNYTLTIYTEPELVGRLSEHLKPYTSYTYDRPNFTILPYHWASFTRDRNRIADAREQNPFYRCNPTKDTAAYGAFQREKMRILGDFATYLPGSSLSRSVNDRVAWVDFGIGKHVPMEGFEKACEVMAQANMAWLCVSRPAEEVKDWRELRQNMCAGWIGGIASEVRDLCGKFDQLAENLLGNDLAPHDETMLEHLAATLPYVAKRVIADHTWIFRSFATVGDALKADMRRREAAGFVERAAAAALKPVAAPPLVITNVNQLMADETYVTFPQPLLGLVMIVKDEAHGIEETLKSIKPYVDRWTILDTGSIDGTQAVIRRVMKDVPGYLYEQPFVDFSTTRNRALDLHGVHTRWVILPDADDVLVGGVNLRKLLSEFYKDETSVNVNIRRGELSYFLPLLQRTDAGNRYRGRVHEVLPGAGATTDVIQLHQTRPARSTEATKARWQRDVLMLQADLKDDPTNERAVFYLAQTFDCLGQHTRALTYYEKRIGMGGWEAERFEAMLRRGRMLERLLPEANDSEGYAIDSAYLEAYRHSPHRAEPLYECARKWYAKDDLAMTYLYAHAAYRKRPPATGSALFVDQDAYDWKIADLVAISAFYQGDKVLGELAADTAVERGPEHAQQRLRNNRAFYAKDASETFGGVGLKEIDYKPAAPYSPTNPSVHYDGTQWRCVVRTTNYKIVNGQYLTPDDNVIYTRNVMLELDGSLSVARAFDMVDEDSTPRSKYPVHGFEDCRLYSDEFGFRCTATVCDFDPTGEGKREIVELTLATKTYAINHARPWRGPWSGGHQKNWMPLSTGETFVYSILPTVLIGNVEKQYPMGRLRGGSQVVKVPDGYLCLVHDVTFDGGNSRTYLHRFVLLDDKLSVTKMSPLFYFKKRGIEFCAGLAFDPAPTPFHVTQTHGRLIASFGVDDCSAWFAEFDYANVIAALSERFVV